LSNIIMPESRVEVKWHEPLVDGVLSAEAARSGDSRLLLASSVCLSDEFKYPLTS
jgi:hypothetical protein